MKATITNVIHSGCQSMPSGIKKTSLKVNLLKGNTCIQIIRGVFQAYIIKSL